MALGHIIRFLAPITTKENAFDTSLALLAERAGLSTGVFMFCSPRIPIYWPKFTENEKVRKLTFTGATNVGKILMLQGANEIMKRGAELGGNAVHCFRWRLATSESVADHLGCLGLAGDH